MIRKATYEDIPALMEIFRQARGIMRASGNMNQWNDSYPSEEIIRQDIASGVCHVLCEDTAPGCTDGRIIATMAFIPGPDPTYSVIYDGEWPDDSPYHVIHRIAVKYHGRGIVDFCFNECFKLFPSIKIDTHRDNIPMQKVLKRNGFVRCGIIYLENGDERFGYEKLMSRPYEKLR